MLLDDYLKPDILAQELGIHQRTLRKLEERGEGPPKTVIGRKVLFRRESVVAWLQSREQRKTNKGRK
jgi:excisionase family DNA binding protein